ncbi:MAG: N-acetylmuramoyl-L-alanine amidase family protein [Clostridia bacterium]|nr:N-acetylmuramoyl-L-alanine amidase [Clostridium sp.]
MGGFTQKLKNKAKDKVKNKVKKKITGKLATFGLALTVKIIPTLLIAVTAASIVDFVVEIFTADNTPKEIYEQLEIEDVAELIQIKGNQEDGYYLDFIDDIDKKLDSLIETLNTSSEYHNVPKDKKFLKKLLKAEAVTKFPNLGGKIPEGSDGFQGAINIKRVTPNKEVGAMVNTGKDDTNILEKEPAYDDSQMTPREEQIKKWEEGKEIVLINDAVVYEKVKNKWGDVKYEDSKKVVKIKKSSKVTYTGKYEVSQDKLNDSTVIYVEVKGKNTRDEDITGYIRSSQINLRSTEEGISKEDKEDKEDKKETTSRATEKDKKKKEKITVGGDKKEYVVAIAAGHNNTDDIGAESPDKELHEEELTIKVAEKVEELVKERYSNVKVVQTGSTSANPGGIKMEERTKLARDAKPDLCIQIHFDISEDPEATGVQAIYKEQDEISQQLAEILSRNISQEMGLYNRGAGTDVERTQVKNLGIIESAAITNFPSVVTEGGFLSNSNDKSIIKDGGTDKYAEGIVKGIKEYLEADHSGRTAHSPGETTETPSIESKIRKMKYVPLEEFEKLKESSVEEAIKYFSLNEDNKLVTLSWNMKKDGTIEIKENSPMDFRTALQKYHMPYEYLLYYYIDTDYKAFSEKLADIVLDSEIVIALQDNVSTVETSVQKQKLVTVSGENPPIDKATNGWQNVGTVENSKTESVRTKIDITYIETWCVKVYQANSYSKNILNMGDEEEIIVNAPGKVTETKGDKTLEEKVVDGKAMGDYSYIEYERTLSTTHTISNSYDSGGDMKVDGITNKYVDLYIEQQMNKKIKEDWLFLILEKNERIKQANLVDLTKYLMFLASNTDYGVTEFDFDIFKLETFKNTTSGGQLSLTTPVLSREKFIEAMEAYGDKSGNSGFITNFMPFAGEIYDVSMESNVNPELVVVTAKTEQNFVAGGGANNYWGIAVENGSQSGSSFPTLFDGIRAYAEVIHSFCEGGSKEAMVMERYEARKDTGCDPLGYGLPGTFSGMQSCYSFLGYHVYGDPGTGGFYYMDPAREGVTAIYKTHEEFLEKCYNAGGEHALGAVTTPWEQGQYSAWQCKGKIEVWNDIFGDYGSLGGAGGQAIPADGDGYFQTYTSSTGRTYREYKQWTGSYANMVFEYYSPETIAQSGCSITSIATVTSGYNNNQSPATLASRVPSLASLMTEGGAECSGYEPADASKLTSGNPAIVSISGTLVTERGSKYYGGHYIAILDGRNGNEVYVSDVGANDAFCGGWTDVQNIINIVDQGVLYVNNR